MEILTEILGYLASIVVLISMITRDMLKLRIINSIGCALFVIYSFIIQSYPLVLLNSIIIIVQIINIYKLKHDFKIKCKKKLIDYKTNK